MKRITVDCRFASSPTGLGRYTRSLMGALLRRSDDIEYILLVRSENEEWISRLPSPARFTQVRAAIPTYSAGEHTTLPAIIRAQHPDAHCSMHFPLPLFAGVPSAITVHDLILHRYANGASVLKQLVYRLLMRRSIHQASAIFVPTVAVADDLARQYGDRVRFRTTVTGEGVDDAYVPQPPEHAAAVCKRYGISGEFFLYVGNAKEHKNVPVLLDAYRRLPAGSPSLVLVCHGKEADALTLPPHTLLLRDLHDDDLPALYSAARCFVTATLDEGFCLPVAEALACGCPVIASDIPVVRETAKGNAVLVPPDPQSLAAALASPPPRTEPQRGWSWDDAARCVAETLMNIAARA